MKEKRPPLLQAFANPLIVLRLTWRLLTRAVPLLLLFVVFRLVWRMVLLVFHLAWRTVALTASLLLALVAVTVALRMVQRKIYSLYTPEKTSTRASVDSACAEAAFQLASMVVWGGIGESLYSTILT